VPDTAPRSGLADKPLGTGSVDLGGAVLRATSDYTSGSPIDQTYNVASAGKLNYDSGAIIHLNKGDDTPVNQTAGGNWVPPVPTNFNNSLTVTVGAAASPAGTALARKAGGSGSLLLLAHSGATNLGTATGEKLLVNGGVNTVPVNGTDSVVPTVIISTNNFSNSDPAQVTATGPSNLPQPVSGPVINSEGFFATYDNTVGFKVANMSSNTDINLATSSDPLCGCQRKQQHARGASSDKRLWPEDRRGRRGGECGSRRTDAQRRRRDRQRSRHGHHGHGDDDRGDGRRNAEFRRS
jgi:hypothetical protein